MQRVRDPLIGVRLDGDLLRALRIQAELTQETVAERARISEHWYRRIEKHHKQPSRLVAEDIAEALGVTLGAFCVPVDDDRAA